MDGRADQYALACAAVEMLTGSPPFLRDDSMALMWAQLEAEPPRPTERRPELAPAVDEVIAAAMAKSPAGRYPTCRDFAMALAAACGQSGRPRTSGASGPAQWPGQDQGQHGGQWPDAPPALEPQHGYDAPEPSPPPNSWPWPATTSQLAPWPLLTLARGRGTNHPLAGMRLLHGILTTPGQTAARRSQLRECGRPPLTPPGLPARRPAGMAITGRPAGTPMSDRPAGTPMSDRPAGDPVSGRPAGTPTARRQASRPISGRRAGMPSSRRRASPPISGRRAGMPSSRRQASPPTTCPAAGGPVSRHRAVRLSLRHRACPDSPDSRAGPRRVPARTAIAAGMSRWP